MNINIDNIKNKKLRLFVDCRWLAQPGQGAWTYFYELYSRIVKKYPESFEFVFGIPDGSDIPEFLKSNNSKLIVYKNNSFFWRQFKLSRIINNFDIDYCHFQYVLPFFLDKKICKILTIHDLIFLRNPEFFPLMYRIPRALFFFLSAKKSNKLLTISSSSKRDINYYFKVPLNEIEVIELGHGSRLTNINKSIVPKLLNKKYLLSVGRHEPRKNYQRLIEAYSKENIFNKFGIYLVIVGWVAKDFVNNLSIDHPGVLLIKECSDSELAWIYENSSGFIFPSIAEGFGLPLVEALEFNIPSATSDTYPIAEIKDHCIVTFNPYSMQDIGNALLKLATNEHSFDPRPYPGMSWDRHVDNFIKFILNDRNDK